MNTKLTLQMEEELIRRAKTEASKRGKSVSQMVADYFASLEREPGPAAPLPPVTSSLLGILKGSPVSEEDYRKHLCEKHQ